MRARARACDFVYFKRALGFQPCARVGGVWLLEGFSNFIFVLLPFFVLAVFCSAWLVFFILPVCQSSCFLFCFWFCLPVHISVDCSFTYLFEFVCSFTSFSSSSVCLILNLSPNLNYNLYLNLTHVCARVLILCRPTRRFAASLIF